MKRFLMLAAVVGGLAVGGTQLAVAHDGPNQFRGGSRQSDFRGDFRNGRHDHNLNRNFGNWNGGRQSFDRHHHGHHHQHGHWNGQGGWGRPGYGGYRGPIQGQGSVFYYSQPGFSIGIGSGLAPVYRAPVCGW